MGYLGVIVAAVATFMLGAVWYSIFAKPWMADSGVPLTDGAPANRKSPVPYITCLLAQIFVAGFLRLLLEEVDIDGLWNAVQWGTGVGLFFITPWIMLNNGYAMRSARLTAIDGGYAVVGCGLMAAILYWMAPSV